jgi:hypothetical protein
MDGGLDGKREAAIQGETSRHISGAINKLRELRE